MTPSFSLMRLTKPSSPIRRFHSIYEIEGARIVRSSPLLLQECWLYRNPLRVHSRRRRHGKASDGSMWNCGSYGTAASPPSLMGCPTSFNAEPRQSTPRMDRRKPRRWSVSIWKMPRLFARTECSRIGSVWGCAPYVWVKTPNGLSSWEFFDKLLHTANVGTPGSGLPQVRLLPFRHSTVGKMWRRQ